MTVCEYSLNVIFWISLIISIAILAFLTLYLPFKKIKSRWRFAFIPLFIILFIVITGLNLTHFADTCASLYNKHLVKDYNRNIASIDEANEIFRERARIDYSEAINQTRVENLIESSLNYTTQTEEGYAASFGWMCYELHTNGKLYKIYCAD